MPSASASVEDCAEALESRLRRTQQKVLTRAAEIKGQESRLLNFDEFADKFWRQVHELPGGDVPQKVRPNARDLEGWKYSVETGREFAYIEIEHAGRRIYRRFPGEVGRVSVVPLQKFLIGNLAYLLNVRRVTVGHSHPPRPGGWEAQDEYFTGSDLGAALRLKLLMELLGLFDAELRIELLYPGADSVLKKRGVIPGRLSWASGDYQIDAATLTAIASWLESGRLSEEE